MSKITEKQLIASLSQLKEIKPRKEWAVLLKSQILAESSSAKASDGQAKFAGFVNTLSALFVSKRLAYAFSAFLFIIVGLIGFAHYTMPGDLLFPVKKLSEQSQASLTGQTVLKQDVATLSNRVNDLAQVAKEGKKSNIPSAISEINQNVSALAKNLKANPTSDPVTLKNIAVSLKTLADVPGTDLTSNPDVKDLYQTVVESQIADLQKTTLTDAQKKTLTDAEQLYKDGKYTDALEKILLINN